MEVELEEEEEEATGRVDEGRDEVEADFSLARMSPHCLSLKLLCRLCPRFTFLPEGLS